MWEQVGQLHAHHGDVRVEVRLLKLTEEVGEVADAFLGMEGLFSELPKMIMKLSGRFHAQPTRCGPRDIRRSARIGSSRRLAGNMALRIDMCGCDQLLRCSGVVVPGWLPAGGTGPARCGG